MFTIQDFINFANGEEMPICIKVDNLLSMVHLACLKENFKYIKSYLDKYIPVDIYVEYYLINIESINELNNNKMTFEQIN